jgi:hypothetical protein
VRKWSIEFMETDSDPGSFHEVEDQCDRKMALGMLVPPQAFLDVKQTALGGPTTADVLMDLAEELLLMDAADIDRHVNEYVFPAVSRANFPPDSPKVRVRTVGLEAENTELLHTIIEKLLQRPDTDVSVFDLRGALERERMPLTEGDGSPDPGVSPDGENGGDGESAESRDARMKREAAEQIIEAMRISAQTGDQPDRETLERILSERLPNVPPVDQVDESEITRALEKLATDVPELAGIVDWEGGE